MQLANKKKLKVGILINDYNISHWQLKIIDQIKNSWFAEIGLIIKNNTTAATKFSNLFGKIIFQAHLKLDQFVLARGTDYFKIIHSGSTLNGIDEIAVAPIEKDGRDYISENDITAIKNYNVDIILKFGFKQLTGEILNAAKYGLWSYSADDDLNAFQPFGYWEVICNEKTTSSAVQILNEDGATVIHRIEMLSNYISISKNRNACYWRAATVIPHIIEALYQFGDLYLTRLKENNNSVTNESRFDKSLSSLTAFKNICSHFRKVSKRLCQKIFFNDHWDVMYKVNSQEISIPSLNEFKLLPTPTDRFWADPFVITKENRHYIFVEELLYKTNKGHISVIEIDSHGNVLDSKKVLEKSYHLSYPFLFDFYDTHYMIPETGANKTIELYKCVAFPHKWEFVINLMENISTADVTLFYYNRKWWLFCCMDKSEKNIGMLDELHLFSADCLFTQNWQSHPQNPICTNTRTARPAGKIFIQNEKMYRPSQDCSGIYGRGININEIIKLSETEYEEHLITKIIPEENEELLGTHTFNTDDKITVIDGFKYRSKMNKFNTFVSNFKTAIQQKAAI